MTTKKLTDETIAAMSKDERSRIRIDESAAVTRAKSEGKKRLPATPVSDWINAHPDEHKSGGRSTTSHSSNASGSGRSIAPENREKVVRVYVERGLTRPTEIARAMRADGQPVGPWVKDVIGRILAAVPAKETPAKKQAAAKSSAPAKKAPARRSASELSKAHQTRGAGKKAPAKKAVAAKRQSSPARRVRKAA